MYGRMVEKMKRYCLQYSVQANTWWWAIEFFLKLQLELASLGGDTELS